MEERVRHSRILSRASRRHVDSKLDHITSQRDSSPSQLDGDGVYSQQASPASPGSLIAEFNPTRVCAIAPGKRASDIADDVSPSSEGDIDSLPFPFMKLPAELRLAIYRKAFVRDKPILLRSAPINTEDYDSEESASRSVLGGTAQRQSYRTMVLMRLEGGSGRPVHDGGRKRRKVSKSGFKPSENALVPQLLAVCQTIYHEARPVLYSENIFELELSTSIATLMSLPQPSRSLIKQINLSVPTHHDIIEGFTDLVRLGLRYCWGLERLGLTLPPFASSPRPPTLVATTNVYANSFQILRWLPQKTTVILDGGKTEDIERVIEENQRMADTLDKTAYFKRQHQMPERPTSDWSE